MDKKQQPKGTQTQTHDSNAINVYNRVLGILGLVTSGQRIVSKLHTNWFFSKPIARSFVSLASSDFEGLARRSGCRDWRSLVST